MNSLVYNIQEIAFQKMSLYRTSHLSPQTKPKQKNPSNSITELNVPSYQKKVDDHNYTVGRDFLRKKWHI